MAVQPVAGVLGMLGVFACVSERRAVQAPASPICFEVTDWLGPEICDWGAFVAVQGCVEADAVELRYTYTINQPCGPNDEPQLLRYGPGSPRSRA